MKMVIHLFGLSRQHVKDLKYLFALRNFGLDLFENQLRDVII